MKKSILVFPWPNLCLADEIYKKSCLYKKPKIKPPTLKNTKFFWARQVPTFPVHHLLVGSLSLDGPSADKFLKKALSQEKPVNVFSYSQANKKINMTLSGDAHGSVYFHVIYFLSCFSRVNGALSNMPEFSKTFNCPLNSKMNPKIKCDVWWFDVYHVRISPIFSSVERILICSIHLDQWFPICIYTW